MDSSPPVNWEALDSLILQFAKSEHLVHPDELSNPNPSSPPSSDSSPSESSPSSSSSSYKSRLIIRQIRRCIEAGEIDAALDQLRARVPVLLDDHRVLFRIQKQKFVELLRRGTEEDRELAIQCLRKSLAPCALDAYPEAYEEFKHVLLALIYSKDDQTSPVTNEWSEKRRYDLAGLISSILRAHLHAYDPIFSMTLRYLISIHKVFCTRQGIPSPISDLTERLLFEERDPPALPQETFFEAPPFDEVDIQALAHAVELTRQGAIDSLKFAKGDLFLAFQNELCRMKFDLPALDKLVHEYCIYRGIIQAFPTNTDASNSAQENETDDLSNTERENMETRFTNERSNNNSNNNEKEDEIEDCSTSEVTRQELGFNNRGLRRCRNYSSNSIMRRRKRWRGRKDEIDSVGTSCENQESQAGMSQDVNQEMGEKYEVMLDMRELAYKGMAQKVVEEINCLDPDFFNQNPTLLFQLKQVEFLKLVSVGDSDGALKVASEYLGPLAAKNEGLVKPLKETLITLLKPNDDAMINKAVPLPLLATSLQVAMGRRLGIEEPQLMKILRSTLHTHTQWFKLQMCKDKFEHLLKIDHLKDTDSLSLSKRVEDPNGSRMLTGGDLNNGSGSMISSCESSAKLLEEGGSPRPASSAGDVGGCDDNAILKVMEFLALPRADAIQLLMQYNGNAETVIQNIFS